MGEAHRLSLAPSAARFRVALEMPHVAQRARLIALLKRAAGTRFGQDHRLAEVRNLEDFQDRVPIRTYEEHAPYIEAMLRGEQRILTNEPVKVFERTSGSTGANKLIPYPSALFEEFSAATAPWLHDLYSNRPALRGTSAYWAISPVGRREERTQGGDPIGLGDDAEYFPPPIRALIRLLLPVPPQVAKLSDIATCRYVTLRYLLADPCLGLISVWSPTFLSLLLEFGREHADRLADDVARGTVNPPGGLPPGLGLPQVPARPHQAPRVHAAFPESGPLQLERVWPRLALVSCWTDAGAAQQIPELRRLLPSGVEVQGKGLLATEGVVSIPLLDREGCVLAVSSHLLELQPADDLTARPVAPHRVDVGGVYRPLLSTGGGLYRYPLGDAVEVVGRVAATPTVRFVGRVDGVSDVCGEKLAPARVDAVLSEALASLHVRFRLLAPTQGDPPTYSLFLEASPEPTPAERERLGADVDRLLRQGKAYDYCRHLGQLGPLRVVPVREGAARYEAALVARGQRAGTIKPPGLHQGTFWGEVYFSASTQ